MKIVLESISRAPIVCYCLCERSYSHTIFHCIYVQYGSRQNEFKNLSDLCAIFRAAILRKSHHTFVVCAGSTGIQNCCIFCQTRRIFTAKGAKDCSALQDGALRHGHQSAALLAGESDANATMFSSAAAARVTFFLTCTVVDQCCAH